MIITNDISADIDSPSFTGQTPDGTLAVFTSCEQQVIRFAEQDWLSSIRRPNLGARILKGLFGRRISNGLANVRLEVLRRLVVRLHRDTLQRAEGEIEAAVAASFSLEQVAVLIHRYDKPFP